MSDVFDSAGSFGLGDGQTTEFARVMRDLLTPMSDTPVDVGISADSADLWVTHEGREYFVTIRASNRQRAIESN